MSDRMRTALGVLRSLGIYYLHRRRPRMDRLYAAFVAPGDLVFDIGSHVGDRVGSFRRLGARVIAVEPQPALVRTLGLLYGRDPLVHLESAAVGRHTGRGAIHLNLSNPTVSTLSDDFRAATRGAPGWEGQRWERAVPVACITLDDLIARHGIPAFVKIDVEGYEAEVLAGVTQSLAALSFEFTTIQRGVAQQALDACGRLGLSRFNAVLGEDCAFIRRDWTDADEIAAWLHALPLEANSGDLYAVRADHPVVSGSQGRVEGRAGLADRAGRGRRGHVPHRTTNEGATR
jgi:FkbM family methyltransferase